MYVFSRRGRCRARRRFRRFLFRVGLSPYRSVGDDGARRDRFVFLLSDERFGLEGRSAQRGDDNADSDRNGKKTEITQKITQHTVSSL
jgi:hypothetical protein